MSPDVAFVSAARRALQAVADPDKAEPMRQYMKSELPFLGVPKPDRVRALQPILRRYHLTDRGVWEATIRMLWDDATFREERYAATYVVQAPLYQSIAREPASIPLYEYLIVTGAWWDHVDDLAIRSVGPALVAHHDVVTPIIKAWSRDRDRWRRRASVICQIGAKHDIDVPLLVECILANVDDSDFFLRKGIGWALRQHAKVDPGWVRTFVAQHAARLSPLSRREALKNIG
jgi:3-methyladenine DNA glycosylase AlkD